MNQIFSCFFAFLQILARLANPKEGIYTLQDDSRAIRLGGFMNIPMDRFGVRSPRLREMAKEPVMDSLNMPDYAGGDDIWYWKNE